MARNGPIDSRHRVTGTGGRGGQSEEREQLHNLVTERSRRRSSNSNSSNRGGKVDAQQPDVYLLDIDSSTWTHPTQLVIARR